jgi:hypothetical protein
MLDAVAGSAPNFLRANGTIAPAMPLITATDSDRQEHDNAKHQSERALHDRRKNEHRDSPGHAGQRSIKCSQQHFLNQEDAFSAQSQIA